MSARTAKRTTKKSPKKSVASQQRKKETSLHLPLEIQYPKEFGDLDEEQQFLLCEKDALDLILIENASQLFKDLMFQPGTLEYILTQISQGTDTTILESRAFNLDDLIRVRQQSNPPYEMIEALVKLRQSIPKIPTRHVLWVVSLEHDEESAHYGALIFDKDAKKTEMFDSMMAEKGDRPGTMRSGYTDNFEFLSNFVFGQHDMVYPSCLKPSQSLQYTGGFSTNIAPYLQLQRYKVKPNAIFALNLQSTESQNHFCYLWSVWYIHMRLLGYSLATIKNELAGTDPLSIIKEYGYLLINNIYIKDKPIIDSVKYREFFEAHFLSIWSQQHIADASFHRYDLVSAVKKTNDMRELWIASTQVKEKDAEEYEDTISKEDRATIDKKCLAMASQNS